MLKQTIHIKQLDPEWVELILAAKAIGLTPSEIRQFLQNCAGNFK